MGTIAISTCAFPDLPLEAALDRIAELASAVEVRCNVRHGIETRARRRALLASGLRSSVHAPEHIAIWTANESLRHSAVAAHERLIEACAEAGAELYLVHPDYNDRPIELRTETRAALRRSFGELRDLEDVYPVRIVVENMPGLAQSHFTVPDLDLCGLGLALDVGHAWISGTLHGFLQTSQIAHLHLHDNRGSSDIHASLGHGNIPPALLHRALGSCEGLCVLEHKTEADVNASLAFLGAMEKPREVA